MYAHVEELKLDDCNTGAEKAYETLDQLMGNAISVQISPCWQVQQSSTIKLLYNGGQHILMRELR